jgi:hypothetical protein
MDDLVNKVAQLQKLIAPSGIEIHADKEESNLCFRSPLGATSLRLVRLYRPSSRDIEQASASDVLLLVTAPTQKALEAAEQTNYLVLPDGACRIVANGIVLILEVPSPLVKPSHQVKLNGRTGIVAETLLLGGSRQWSVQDLAYASRVSPALAYRVLNRLEQEGLLLAHGSGPEKVRTVKNLRALAELWSREERKPQTVLRGFLYASSLEELARKVLAVYPDGAIGGTLAANLYKPTLTRVLPPLRIWVKGDFNPDPLFSMGLERTNEGANLEFVARKDDPWRVHRDSEEIPRVSKARAWLEISESTGRTQELAEALLLELEERE